MAATHVSLPSGDDDQEAITFSKVISESKRIIRLHNRHFQALTFVFLFPLSIISIVYQLILKYLQANPSNSFNQNPYHFFLLFCLVYTISTILSFSGFASLSYSTYHLYKGEPVDLISSLKSAVRSFLPLLSTTLVSNLIGILILSPVPVLVLIIYKWLHQTPYFMHLILVIMLIFFVVQVCFLMNWALACSVVVIESKWGYSPLKRSADLVQNHKRVALLLLFYPVVATLVVFYGMIPRDQWSSLQWWLVLFILIGSFLLSQLLLVAYVAQTVLYLHCRKAHDGGLPYFDNPEKKPLLQ